MKKKELIDLADNIILVVDCSRDEHDTATLSSIHSLLGLLTTFTARRHDEAVHLAVENETLASHCRGDANGILSRLEGLLSTF